MCDLALYSTVMGDLALYSTVMCDLALYSTVMGDLALYSTVMGDLALYSTVMGDLALYSTVMCDLALYSTVMCDLALYSTVMCDLALYSTVMGDLFACVQHTRGSIVSPEADTCKVCTQFDSTEISRQAQSQARNTVTHYVTARSIEFHFTFESQCSHSATPTLLLECWVRTKGL